MTSAKHAAPAALAARIGLPTVALAAAALGALSAVPGLPSPLKAVLLGAFVFTGPGSAALSAYRPVLPARTLYSLIPVVGVAAVILVTTAAVYSSATFRPTPIVLVLAGATALAALLVPRWSGRRTTGGDA
jgi:hypothetical protein